MKRGKAREIENEREKEQERVRERILKGPKDKVTATLESPRDLDVNITLNNHCIYHMFDVISRKWYLFLIHTYNIADNTHSPWDFRSAELIMMIATWTSTVFRRFRDFISLFLFRPSKKVNQDTYNVVAEEVHVEYEEPGRSYHIHKFIKRKQKLAVCVIRCSCCCYCCLEHRTISFVGLVHFFAVANGKVVVLSSSIHFFLSMKNNFYTYYVNWCMKKLIFYEIDNDILKLTNESSKILVENFSVNYIRTLLYSIWELKMQFWLNISSNMWSQLCSKFHWMPVNNANEAFILCIKMHLKWFFYWNSQYDGKWRHRYIPYITYLFDACTIKFTFEAMYTDHVENACRYAINWFFPINIVSFQWLSSCVGIYVCVLCTQAV